MQSLLFIITKLCSKYAQFDKIFYHKTWSETEIAISYPAGNQDLGFLASSFFFHLLFKNHALENKFDSVCFAHLSSLCVCNATSKYLLGERTKERNRNQNCYQGKFN